MSVFFGGNNDPNRSSILNEVIKKHLDLFLWKRSFPYVKKDFFNYTSPYFKEGIQANFVHLKMFLTK